MLHFGLNVTLILFQVHCHTKSGGKKSIFLSGKYQSVHRTSTNFCKSCESTFGGDELWEFLLCVLKGKHFLLVLLLSLEKMENKTLWEKK